MDVSFFGGGGHHSPHYTVPPLPNGRDAAILRHPQALGRRSQVSPVICQEHQVCPDSAVLFLGLESALGLAGPVAAFSSCTIRLDPVWPWPPTRGHHYLLPGGFSRPPEWPLCFHSYPLKVQSPESGQRDLSAEGEDANVVTPPTPAANTAMTRQRPQDSTSYFHISRFPPTSAPWPQPLLPQSLCFSHINPLTGF